MCIRDRYEEASIIKDLPDLDMRKHLILIYGEKDSTVPIWSTREFFYQAKIFGKRVSLLKLEDEGHIIRGRDNLNLMCQFIADKLWIEDLECNS